MCSEVYQYFATRHFLAPNITALIMATLWSLEIVLHFLSHHYYKSLPCKTSRMLTLLRTTICQMVKPCNTTKTQTILHMAPKKHSDCSGPCVVRGLENGELQSPWQLSKHRIHNRRLHILVSANMAHQRQLRHAEAKKSSRGMPRIGTTRGEKSLLQIWVAFDRTGYVQ